MTVRSRSFVIAPVSRAQAAASKARRRMLLSSSGAASANARAVEALLVDAEAVVRPAEPAATRDSRIARGSRRIRQISFLDNPPLRRGSKTREILGFFRRIDRGKRSETNRIPR